MAGTKAVSRGDLEREYEEAASAYCDYLREHHPEHFMESTPQGTQRKITLAAFDMIHERRPEIQCFNELLIQYKHKGDEEFQRVVPDNMVVVHPEPIVAKGNFAIPLQPVGPYWTLEYVSKGDKRKDTEDNYARYERDLRVPYYLTFYPDNDELSLYKLNSRKRYSAVKPNETERYPIPALELEIGMVGKWVRFWFRGELLPLTGELLRDRDMAYTELEKERQRAEKLAAMLRAAGIDPDA